MGHTETIDLVRIETHGTYPRSLKRCKGVQEFLRSNIIVEVIAIFETARSMRMDIRMHLVDLKLVE